LDFLQGLRELFVFAGQRRREYLNDFFAFNVDTHQVRVIWNGDGNVPSKSRDIHVSIPATGYTQRATIDPELDEIYVLSVIELVIVGAIHKTSFELSGFE
jgi:muskelin